MSESGRSWPEEAMAARPAAATPAAAIANASRWPPTNALTFGWPVVSKLLVCAVKLNRTEKSPPSIGPNWSSEVASRTGGRLPWRGANIGDHGIAAELVRSTVRRWGRDTPAMPQ